MTASATLAALLQAFFTDRLRQQRQDTQCPPGRRALILPLRLVS